MIGNVYHSLRFISNMLITSETNNDRHQECEVFSFIRCLTDSALLAVLSCGKKKSKNGPGRCSQWLECRPPEQRSWP